MISHFGKFFRQVSIIDRSKQLISLTHFSGDLKVTVAERVLGRRPQAGRGHYYCPRCHSVFGSLAWLDPELAAEWHEDNDLTPPGTSSRSRAGSVVKWRCAANPEHLWEAAVSDRSAGRLCPHCSTAGTSQIEKAFLAAAQVHDPEASQHASGAGGWTSSSPTCDWSSSTTASTGTAASRDRRAQDPRTPRRGLPGGPHPRERPSSPCAGSADAPAGVVPPGVRPRRGDRQGPGGVGDPGDLAPLRHRMRRSRVVIGEEADAFESKERLPCRTHRAPL